MYFIVEYLGRHWNGDFSLRRSFWLNGVAFWLLASVLFYQLSPYIDIYVYLLVKLTVAIVLWVGIWRSATKHPIKWQRILAKTVVILFVLFIASGLIKYGP